LLAADGVGQNSNKNRGLEAMSILEDWGWDWASWQRGKRGEYWFLAQVICLIAFVLLPIQSVVKQTAVSPSVQVGLIAISGILGTIGLVLIGKGLLDLGRSLTPLPYPRKDGELVTTGVYGIVRHPLYGGIILTAFGWVLFTLSWPHFLGLLAIAWLLDRKATLEERWLEQKYPDYGEYRSRAKKLIPWIL
jgi:protein-S-isoprenylcysteine O-methyltransferase Ste14